MLLAKNEIDRDMKGGMTTRRRCRTISGVRACMIWIKCMQADQQTRWLTDKKEKRLRGGQLKCVCEKDECKPYWCCTEK